jgi:hypothetical protein
MLVATPFLTAVNAAPSGTHILEVADIWFSSTAHLKFYIEYPCQGYS